ncbi:methyltransferase [Cedecea davisae]|uniref:Methyltransferase n=1 Tax=Cedecea davisae TaxID=158484 RepID=A0ABS6DL61_9ENTR|nr:methyltransferase [Cedecea davisae]MBU4683959.1 methyltransferase [Cedecea davisae]MBU4688108.1 methyltransferase [Cedecea davisae]
MQNNTVVNKPDNRAGLYLIDQVMGYAFHAALRTAAQLGVADHLLNGPETPEALARKFGVEAQALHRIMRLLATRDIFRETKEGEFELTPAAEYLCTHTPNSLRAAMLMLTDQTFWTPLGNLVEAVKGHSAFQQAFGKTFFEYWSQQGEGESDFHVGMSSMSGVENDVLVNSYDFPEHASVVDVAGGFGGLLLKVLRKNPGLHGILFDQPHVLPRNRLHELGDDSRWELAPGSFFEKCPAADFYLLKYITHDWADEDAAKILYTCRQAMNPGGKVLIMDTIIKEDNAPHTGKSMDLLLMASFDGGRERTEKEIKQLLAKADLKLNRIIDTGFYISIIEAVAN